MLVLAGDDSLNVFLVSLEIEEWMAPQRPRSEEHATSSFGGDNSGGAHGVLM